MVALAILVLAAQASAIDWKIVNKFHKHEIRVQQGERTDVVKVFSEDAVSAKDLEKLRLALSSVNEIAMEYKEQKKKDDMVEVPPDMIVFCNDEVSMAKAAHRPRLTPDGRITIGLCVYGECTLYVSYGIDNWFVTGHELGHWFFGAGESMADDFSDFAKKRWKPLWKAASDAEKAARKVEKDRAEREKCALEDAKKEMEEEERDAIAEKRSKEAKAKRE
jgi:hypothetical protein